MSGTAGALYAIWGAIGVSVLAEFALLLHLQRTGLVEISDRGGALDANSHVSLALVLLAASAAAVVLLLRARRGSFERPARSPTVLKPRPALLDRDPPDGAALLRPEPVPYSKKLLDRPAGLSVACWAIAEGLALVGMLLTLALPPVPRLAVMVYFTGALALWLWSRPIPSAKRGE